MTSLPSTRTAGMLYNLKSLPESSAVLFLIKKTITPFILPPGIFILPVFLISFFLVFRKRDRLALGILSVCVLLWALSTAPVANTLMWGLEADVAIPSDATGDVIILLGGGIIDGVPDLTGQAAPSQQMMGRVVAAVRLYKRLKLPIIVTGGSREEAGTIAEAPVVKRFLEDLGVPAEMIIEEDRARDTVENAQFSAAICRQKNYSRPIVLTSAYHLRRARMAFAAADMDVVLFPAYYLGSSDPKFTWMDWLPRARALYTSSMALHEYVGLLYYRIVES